MPPGPPAARRAREHRRSRWSARSHHARRATSGEQQQAGRAAARRARLPRHRAARARAPREPTNILLFVDQFEELYTLVPDADGARRVHRVPGRRRRRRDRARCAWCSRCARTSSIASREDPRVHGRADAQGLFFLEPPEPRGPARRARAAGRDGRLSVRDAGDGRRHARAPRDARRARCRCCSSRPRSCGRRAIPARKLLTAAELPRDRRHRRRARHATPTTSSREHAPQRSTLARAIFLRLVTPERTRAIVALDELRELSRERRRGPAARSISWSQRACSSCRPRDGGAGARSRSSTSR